MQEGFILSLKRLPEWTTPVRIESGGKYPLGLNRFHDGLEDILIKGVISAANRLRYFTYCCWAIGDIENNIICNNYSEFIHAFTLRENALALGLYLMQPDYTVYGSDAIKSFSREDNNTYDCDFRLMQSNDLGAFGLYYKGTIFNWGLTETDDKGIIRLTHSGKKLYNIINEHYKKLQPEYYKRYKGQKKVPTKVLLEWAQTNDFDNIRQPVHEDERAFYKSIIFHLEKKNVSDYRRDTFAFFMKCIQNCENTNTSFNETILRNIHYYSRYYDNVGNEQPLVVPKIFEDVHFYWLIYEGHVYFRWWLNKYFDAFMQYLKSNYNGSTIGEFLATIDSQEFDKTITAFSDCEKNFFDAHFKDILDLFPKPTKISDKISEESVTNDEHLETVSCVVAKFILITANLYVKFKSLRSDKRYQYIVMQLDDDLWFESLFRLGKFKEISVYNFLRTILKRYIIDQHELIMIKKNDLRRCWFTIENNRYFHQADVSLNVWRPAKYETIMNFLLDMALIDEDNGVIRLSTEGRVFFKSLLRDYY